MPPTQRNDWRGNLDNDRSAHTHEKNAYWRSKRGGQRCGSCAVGRSPVGWPLSMVRAYHRVGLAPMVAVVRLPTSGGSAACLVPLFFHVDGTSTRNGSSATRCQRIGGLQFNIFLRFSGCWSTSSRWCADFCSGIFVFFPHSAARMQQHRL